MVPAVRKLLEDNNIHVCLLPHNTTNKMQLMDLAVNKPAKFLEWYSNENWQQLDPSVDISTAI